MKRIKRFASLVLALVMVMAVSIPVFAADEHVHNINIALNPNDAGTHTYAAYQVFKGDLAPVDDVDGDIAFPGPKYILSNIEWGANIAENGPKVIEKLKKDSEIGSMFTGCETAADVANVLAGFTSTDAGSSGDADVFARIVSDYLIGEPFTSGEVNAAEEEMAQITVTGSGYYMVMDTIITGTTDLAYTRYLLQVVGDANMVVKSEVPSGDKQVYIDGATGITTGDANNASIGSHVSYEITSTVPNYTGYDYYYFIMNDTLSEGLTFDGADSIAVKVGDTTLTQGTDYHVYTGTDVAPKTFRLAFTNIMDKDGDNYKYAVGADIVVTYSATVNDKAVIGTTGNPNTWTLQYSNNPDSTFDKDRDDAEGKPGLPANEANEPLGETPEEKTLTFVTELDITKYANEIDLSDLTKNLLAGAEFTLTGTSDEVVVKGTKYYEAVEQDVPGAAGGTHWLLKNGTYTTTAPTMDSYKEIGVGTKDTDRGYILDNGKYIVPQNKADYDGKTIYKLVQGTNANYVDVNTKYKEVTATETVLNKYNVSMELTTGTDGKISFKGLGAGKYTLTETVTPAGFNTLDPIEFEIVFTAPDRGVVNGTETCMWDLVSDDFEITEGGNNNSLGGVFAANVVNQSGSLLPSTGGIGTTIFYVLGGILVVGACVLLVVRKRMSKSE